MKYIQYSISTRDSHQHSNWSPGIQYESNILVCS